MNAPMNAMKSRWLFAVAGAALSLHTVALLAACATEGEAGEESLPETGTPIPSPATDGGADATDAACASDDCEYYPAECTDDALCYGGLFNSSDPSSSIDLRTQITAIAARSPNDAWVAGTVGQLGRFDGTSWKPSMLGTQQSLLALWLYNDAEIAFDVPQRLYTRGLDAGADAAVSADGWSFFGAATLSGSWSSQRIAATWSYPGGSSLWAGVSGSYLTAALWRMRHSAETGKFTFTAIPADVPSGTIRELYALHGISADEFWAVGPRGGALRVTNAESETPTLTAYNGLTMDSLDGVWVASPSDVWAVGSTGTVRRYRGDARFWEVYEEVPTKQHLRAIAGSSPNDIWIVGNEATVFHYDGAAWKRMKIAGLGGRRPDLEHVWVPSPGKVWIAGKGVLVSLGGKP